MNIYNAWQPLEPCIMCIIFMYEKYLFLLYKAVFRFYSYDPVSCTDETP